MLLSTSLPEVLQHVVPEVNAEENVDADIIPHAVVTIGAGSYHGFSRGRICSSDDGICRAMRIIPTLKRTSTYLMISTSKTLI